MTLVALSMLGGAADARSLYFGINANTRSAGSVGAADAAAETGITRLREDFEWWLVEPSNDEWDWSKTDLMYEEAAERGLGILPIPSGPPCWSLLFVLPGQNCPESAPTSVSEYAEFVGQLAARYGPGGDFWDAHPELDGDLASRHIEILNEPYWNSASGFTLTPSGYASHYKAAVIAGRAANPSTRYLIASAIGGSGGVEWLKEVHAAEPAIGTYIDGIAVHPYPGSHGITYPPATITDESFLNAKLNYEQWVARGVNKPVWITEVGYSSCSDPEHCVPGATQAARENQKAAMLEPLLDALGSDAYGFVHAVYLYNLRQTTPASEPNTKKSHWYGISYGGGYEPLPAWATFVDAVEDYDGVPEANTTITAKTISGESATFSFSRNDPTSTLTCQLDEGAWTACTSPKTYAPTGGGSHTFRVRATNAEGVEATPATHSWVTAPSAVTEAATAVKGTEATLNGTVNPRGSATSYRFEYGPTTAYGTSVPVPDQAVGSGGAGVKVSQTVAGLEGDTIYHYRLVAVNAGGVVNGADKTLLTVPVFGFDSSFGSSGTGPGQFARPLGMATDAVGDVWVVDRNNNRLQKFSPSGEFLMQFGSTGSAAGQLNDPRAVAVAPGGNLWVADAGNSRIQEFTPSGGFVRQITGVEPLFGDRLQTPGGIAVTGNGRVWVSDQGKQNVQAYRETPDAFGNYHIGTWGNIFEGEVVNPANMATNPDRTIVYFADAALNRIYQIPAGSSGGLNQPTFWGSSGSGSGQLSEPYAVAVRPSGNVLVSDRKNSRVQLFTPGGSYLGQFGTAGSGAGQFKEPSGLALAGGGVLFVGDAGNERVQRWTFK